MSDGYARPLYTNTDAVAFRRVIRASLVGRLGAVEPGLASAMGDELMAFLKSVVAETMHVTRLADKKGEVYRQLYQGCKVIGRGSMNTLKGTINAYPWLFPHEFGATITPKEGQFLTIPIAYGLRADGTPVFRNAASWQRFGSFTFTSRKTGQIFLAYNGPSGELRILYILVEYVTVKATLGLNAMAELNRGQLLSNWGEIYVNMMAEGPMFGNLGMV